MQNQKIFKELEGVFKWIEHRKKEKAKHSENQDMNSYHQIKEFFNFLNLEATNEEIEALNELANPDGNQQITYEDLYKVFVQDDKSIEQERKDLQNAFRVLTKDDQFCDLEKLEKQLGIYDKKYKNSVKITFIWLFLKSDIIMNELKQSGNVNDGKLNYKEFLDAQYKK